MSNLEFDPGWVSFTTRNLTSLAKLTLRRSIKFGFMQDHVKQCKCSAASTTLSCKVNCNGVIELDREEKKRQPYEVAPHVMVGSVRVLI
jgi:hypothetical protein